MLVGLWRVLSGGNTTLWACGFCLVCLIYSQRRLLTLFGLLEHPVTFPSCFPPSTTALANPLVWSYSRQHPVPAATHLLSRCIVRKRRCGLRRVNGQAVAALLLKLSASVNLFLSSQKFGLNLTLFIFSYRKLNQSCQQ